jgi:hypothetical protein
MNTFNYSPSPVPGQGIYGSVPGQVSAPPSIWEQTLAANPAFSEMTASESDLIKSQQSGLLSPETLRNIGNYAAARGVSAGQPNSPLANLIGMNVVGTTTEQLQQQGSQNYLGFLGAVGGMQQNPSLMAEIATQNALWAAAPDPSAAGQHAEQLALQYLQSQRPQGGHAAAYSPAGNIGIGSGNPFSGMGFHSQDGSLLSGGGYGPLGSNQDLMVYSSGGLYNDYGSGLGVTQGGGDGMFTPYQGDGSSYGEISGFGLPYQQFGN